MKAIYNIFRKVTGILPVASFFFCQSVTAQRFDAEGGVFHDYSGEISRDIFPVKVSGLPEAIDTAFGLISVCINIDHRKVSDIKVQLMSPDGTTIWLTNRNGGDKGEDYRNTCFSNNGFSGYISRGKAPFVGEYIPDSRMEFINNGQNPNDFWYLIIEDLQPGNTGRLYNFSLQFGPKPLFSPQSSCAAGNIAACNCTPGFKDSVLLPDLVILPSFSNNQLKEYPFDDPVYPGQLRVAATIANIGEGPMEIQGSGEWFCGNNSVDSGTRCPQNKEFARQHIFQNIYYKSGDQLIRKPVVAGTLYFDEKPGHQHYHVDNWIEMRVVKKTKTKSGIKQTVIGRSNKVSYCLFDTGICQDGDSICHINGVLYGRLKLPNYGLGTYTDCHSKRQGISVGGYDTYGMFYEGQDIKLPKGLPKGWYYLQIIADPTHMYKESNRKNNVFEKKIYLQLQ